jgi:transcriptional regulator of acetoin/glycerol metabolism
METTRVRRDWFSQPQNDRRIKSAWEKFFTGGTLPSDGLRCLIDDSWRRCFSEQVDPNQEQAAPPLDEDRIALLRRRHERLISVSTPLMAQARDFLAQTGTVMILTDPEGTILDVEGDLRMRSPLENVRLIPGCNWTESVIGTNAIGTALATRQSVQIHAAEHYCAGIQQWTCSATIIRDPLDASVLGAIDISGLSRSYSRHSLALVITTAGRIESRLSRLEMERRFELLERCVARLSPASQEGVIVLDRRGHLVKANEKAAEALAARGIHFELHAQSRIAALSAEEEAGRHALPEWLPLDWVERIGQGGRVLGSVISIPFARSRPVAVPRAGEGPGLAAAKGFDRIIGSSPALQEALQKAQHLAGSHVPVLLLGETGVGKELFAQGIHEAGAHTEGRFVALNCGGLSRELLASELFGYAEGAFTGARRGGMAGKIEAANGGTLFLDEIGEMPMDLQPHLLRVLEEGEIYRLGENIPRKVSFRLIAATNRDLRQEVKEGRFRMDLFYRIAVTSIRIPALRDRGGEDIRQLVEALAATLSGRHGIPAPAVDDEVIAALECYDWPGNVRELRNVVEAMLLMCRGGRLGLRDLPAELQGCAEPRPAAAGILGGAEQAQIRSALRRNGGNATLAARSLGIAKSTLYHKLKKYDMEDILQETRGSPG